VIGQQAGNPFARAHAAGGDHHTTSGAAFGGDMVAHGIEYIVFRPGVTPSGG